MRRATKRAGRADGLVRCAETRIGCGGGSPASRVRVPVGSHDPACSSPAKQLPCPACNGTGRHESLYLRGFAIAGLCGPGDLFSVSVCEKCNGSGRVPAGKARKGQHGK